MRNKSIKKILTFHNIKSHKCKETVINNYKWNNHIYSKYTQLLITRKKNPITSIIQDLSLNTVIPSWENQSWKVRKNETCGRRKKGKERKGHA